MEPWESLEAERLAREMDLLEERQALAREEEGWRRDEAARLKSLAARRRERTAAVGLHLPASGSRSPAEWFEWVERLAPVLESLGPADGPLGKLLAFFQQWKGVQAMARGLGGGSGQGRGSAQELSRLLQQGDPSEALRMAQGQRLDRETVAFLRSLGVEAREGEEMASALRRLTTGLSAGQKAEMQAKASKLLERLMGPEGAS